MLNECQHDQTQQLELSSSGFGLKYGLQIAGSSKSEQCLLAERSTEVGCSQ